ncbi:oligopeptide transporter [Rhizoctonia solani]|uniref:Oligopeptide transporter n=1 Tax=Rhizoctonia solani TaxID=456999 RepID=A0A8H7H3K5_9AGAM|nr:oligopeptide transporter [Rhizoctonia solani]
MYFGLQTGWISMMSMQSALLGYLFSLFYSRPMTRQELVVLQTTAVATGTMPLAAGFVGVIPALGLLDYKHDNAHPVKVGLFDGILWGCAVALFGVFLAPPLRRQMIIKEELVFPSGTATAQLISVLHETQEGTQDEERTYISQSGSRVTRRRGYEALPAEEPDVSDQDSVDDGEQNQLENYDIAQSWKILGSSFAASALLTLSAYFFPVVFNIPLFGVYLAREWLWYFSPSFSYVGQGIIMGFPTTLSMSLGMVFGWGILSPLSKFKGWAPGPTGDMIVGARGWILWVALAIICADSFVSITPTIYRLLRSAYLTLLSKGAVVVSEEIPEDEPASRLVPNKWVWSGLLASVVVGTVLVWFVFGYEGIKPWATVLGFIMGAVLSHLGARALGETDLNPVSALGKISQVFFAFLQPGNVVANIIAGGVAEAGAQQAGDLMQDLKTGHLLHASPRAQFYGQMIGSVLSIFVSAIAYNLYTRAYTIPGPQFPAPTAYVWLSFARLIGSGGGLPDHIKPFIINAAVITALIASFKAQALTRGKWWAKWIPSGVAFAIGFLNTPSFTIARLIGGIAELLYRRRVARLRSNGEAASDVGIVILASGFVLGEGVAKCTDRESKEDVSDHKSEELFRSLVTCGICLQLYVDPVALLNCLHLACGACAKEWLKSSKSCHECRGPVRGVHDSHYALAVVEAYHSVAPNSSLCQERTPEVIAALREQYKPGQKLTIGEESEESSDESRSDSSESENEDNESPEEESYYRELRLHNDSCPFCDRAGGSGGEFMCPVPCARPADDVGSRTVPVGHTICSECHRFLPTRSDLLHLHCAVCTRTTCSEFGKSCLPSLTAAEVRVELELGVLRDADFRGDYELPLTHAFGDNEFERDIFRTWATNTDFSLQDLFREILAFRGSSLPKASWHGNANEAIGSPYVSVDDKVCTSCVLDLVEASLFEWWICKRQSGAIELPEDVTTREDCWYGVECRTARHNYRHAMNYNHICRKTSIDQQTESHDSPENGNRYVAYSGDLNTTFPAFSPSAIIFRDKGKELSFMCSSVRGTEPLADIIPGKATVWGFGYGVYVYYGEEGQEHLQDGSVQLLIDTKGMHWVPASCGVVPEGCRPVVGGRRVSAGRTLELHHCAVWWYGQRVPGYVCKDSGYAAITWGGQEWYFKDNYELLCWK